MATAGKTEGVFVLFRFGAGGEEIGGEEAEGVMAKEKRQKVVSTVSFSGPFFLLQQVMGEGGAYGGSTGGGDDWESETGGRSEARDSKIFV